jgi:hypothetical protein
MFENIELLLYLTVNLLEVPDDEASTDDMRRFLNDRFILCLEKARVPSGEAPTC